MKRLASLLAGRSIVVRRIASDDAAGLRAFYAGLSDESRRRRFLSAGTAIGRRDVRYFCRPDHDHREGFVAVGSLGGRRAIVGHLCLEPVGPRDAEIAVAVADALQGRGIGRRLTAAAVRWAQEHGIERLRASCATDNAAILGLLRGLGRPVAYGPPAAGSIDLSIDVTTARDAAGARPIPTLTGGERPVPA